MDTYIIAFGSNMGDSVHTLKEALAEMAKNPYLALRKVSSFTERNPGERQISPISSMEPSWQNGTGLPKNSWNFFWKQRRNSGG